MSEEKLAEFRDEIREKLNDESLDLDEQLDLMDEILARANVSANRDRPENAPEIAIDPAELFACDGCQ